MSTQLFPSLSGLGWDVKRAPLWKTRVQEAISGKETRIVDWSSPRWQWELTFDFLRQAGANQQSPSFAGQTYAEFAQLAGFFNARQGMFDSFLYADPDDNAVTGQSLGAGDGMTVAFQLVRALGAFVEPVLAPNVLSAVYLAGVSIPAAGFSAPGAPSLSQVVSGALAATTYFAKVTWVTNSGETLPSAESSLAVSVNNVLKIAAPASPPVGAIGWNAYVSTATGTETKQNGATPIAIGTAWQEPNTGLVAGAALPASNTTGWSSTAWGAASPGVVTFAGAPAAAIAITGDFSFYFPCRFDDDTLDFAKFMAALYQAKSVKFKSLKSA